MQILRKKCKFLHLFLWNYLCTFLFDTYSFSRNITLCYFKVTAMQMFKMAASGYAQNSTKFVSKTNIPNVLLPYLKDLKVSYIYDHNTYVPSSMCRHLYMMITHTFQARCVFGNDNTLSKIYYLVEK